MQQQETLIQEGAVLRLKSGGPDMTVHLFNSSPDNFKCIWFDSEQIYHEISTENGYNLFSELFDVGSKPVPLSEPPTKPGDVVCLKSGGPRMTVIWVNTTEQTASCLRFNGDKELKQHLDLPLLALAVTSVDANS